MAPKGCPVKHVSDLYDPNPPTVSPDMPVTELAALLLDTGRDGYCVVADGKLQGVVTLMDLLFQERTVRLPGLVTLLDAVLPVGLHKAEVELAKMTGNTVGSIMSRDVVTVAQDAPLERVASLMVDRHITVLPVVNDGHLLGDVTRQGILKALYGTGVRRG